MNLHPATLAITCCLALAGAVAPAVAGDEAPPPDAKAQAKRHVETARHAYNLGDFDGALDAYEAAYRALPLPSLLFNIGQCHRQAGRHKEAIFFFDGYLREGRPSAERRVMVEELVVESRAALEAQAELTKAEAPPKLEVAPPPPPVAAPIAPVAVAQTFVDEPEPGIHTRWWFWVLIGVGVAAAGTGTALALTSQETSAPSGSLGTVDWR